MTDNFEAISQRLQETVASSRQESTLLVLDGEAPYAVPVVSKICSIIGQHLFQNTICQKSTEEFITNPPRSQPKIEASFNKNQSMSYRELLNSQSEFSVSSVRETTTMSTADIGDFILDDDGQDHSLEPDGQAYMKQYMADHESQVVLWEQMTSFRKEYEAMRSQVESMLTRMSMDFSTVQREASCQFVLFLSQMGCPSCSTGSGLEACSNRVKALEADVERMRSESTSLTSKVESAMQLKGKLSDREGVIQSLTETIDQLQSHCHQLEENSNDVPQWEELVVSLERALRSIGRLVLDDSDLYQTQQLESEDTSANNNWNSLPLLADSTVTAVRAALARRRAEVQQLQGAVNESEQKMLQWDHQRSDSESRELAHQKELNELRVQLAEVNREKQLQRETTQQAERAHKTIRLELEERETTIRQLQDDLYRERSCRQRMEETLNELRHEEAIQRTSHAELLNEFQQLTCDNNMCRANITSFEERLGRLRREMDQVREERTRLSVALDFSKDERNFLNKQLKENEEKIEHLKDQLRSVQLEKMVAEDSLGRLQVLKSLDDSQISKLNSDMDQMRREGMRLVQDKEELKEDILALKHELVRMEELKIRLESFTSTLEHSLNAANIDNSEMKEQIDHLAQINEQLSEKQGAMEHRCAEIETGNNHLMEEISKLTREFTSSKEREQSWKEEVDRCRVKMTATEEENRALHEQLLSAQNLNQLTQVSIVATQTSYNELQVELERLTTEMQSVGAEKEDLLVELQQLHDSTREAIEQLQVENKQLNQNINDMVKQMQEASNEKAATTTTLENEKREVEIQLTNKLAEVRLEHTSYVETLKAQHSHAMETLERELNGRLEKLEKLMEKKDNESQQKMTLVQIESKGLQDRLNSCIVELETARKELAKLRQEEAEQLIRHKQVVEEFKAEIARLHSDLRHESENRIKEAQSAEQILLVTNENLKRAEQDYSATRAELTAANRELKESQRQVDTLQIQLSKMESQRDEAIKEGQQRGSHLDEIQNERGELRNNVVTLQATIKRLETDREEAIKCLEEARKKIAVLEENRGVLEREIHHLRTLIKDSDQQVARLTEDLNISQQKLERSQDVQNRWKERSEALVEQLQAEQNRTILAEQAVTKYMSKMQTMKIHYQQLEQQYNQKLQQSTSQHSVHQQRLDEMDLTVQKTIARSKRLEEERHNFHSRLIETDKEVGILKGRLRDADTHSQDLTAEMHRLEGEKRELNNRFGVLYSTLKRFVRALEDGQQANSSNSKSQDSGVRFLQPLSTSVLDSEMSMIRDSSANDPDAVQIILQDLMRHILQLQARRSAETTNAAHRDEPTRLEPSSRERQRLLAQQLRNSEGNAAELREQLHQSLQTVASHSSLGAHTLHRESSRLDGLLVPPNRRYEPSSPIRLDP